MPAYVVTFTDTRARPLIALAVALELEAGGQVADVADLPLMDAERVGRLFVTLPGSAHRFPGEYMPGAAITDRSGTLIARYIDGMRGRFAEAGITCSPLTLERFQALRVRRPELPELSTADELAAYLRTLETA